MKGQLLAWEQVKRCALSSVSVRIDCGVPTALEGKRDMKRASSPTSVNVIGDIGRATADELLAAAITMSSRRTSVDPSVRNRCAWKCRLKRGF